MKNYLAFYGSIYYPNGGFRDYKGEFDTLESAVEFILKHTGNSHWGHVFSLMDKKIIYRFNPDDEEEY